MKCSNCAHEIFDGSMFCNYCGTKQPETLSKLYENCFGLWHVTTEGDCEGRTTKDLGIFKGYIDEIAKTLSNQCYYSLKFEAALPATVVKETVLEPKKKVSVSLNGESGYGRMTPAKKREFLKQLFKDRTVKATPTNSYGDFLIEFDQEK